MSLLAPTHDTDSPEPASSARLRRRFLFLVRYGIAGIIGASVQTGILYVWVSLLGLRDSYLLGATLAFVVAFFLTFALQRQWTFRHRKNESALHRQLLWYGVAALVSLGLNILLLALAKAWFNAHALDFFNGWYLLVQIAVILACALASFLINCFYTFRVRR